MTGDLFLRAPALDPTSSAMRRVAWAKWQRRTIEGVVALLAFAVWGQLAYIGGYRLLARIEGVAIGGWWAFDALTLFVGISGSIAGVGALWALAMQALGHTPTSMVGAPDDEPADRPQRRTA
jgi:hypothetical protein